MAAELVAQAAAYDLLVDRSAGEDGADRLGAQLFRLRMDALAPGAGARMPRRSRPGAGGAGGRRRGRRHPLRALELVSLLASDFPRARELPPRAVAPLAAATEPAARLCETVLAFLAANGSSTKWQRSSPSTTTR